MKVLSLFSGVGGFDLGLENAGMETVFQCEWDKHATSILQRHWPDVPRWGDITTLTGRHILDHAPVIDVVAWGSPCQDLSVAGKRAGLSGQRSGLFHEGIRIIKELRKETNNAYPRISIWENVYGALNSNKGADFGLVLDEMAEAGAMVIEWRVLDAQYFGVPQRRRRVFVVAVFDPRIAANCPDPLLPLRQGVRWNPATSRTTRQTTPRPAEESVGSSGHRMRGFGDYTDDDTASAIKARDWKDATDLVTEQPILIDRSAFNQGINAQYDTHISDDPVTPSLVARGPHAVATSAIVMRQREGKPGGGKGPLLSEDKSLTLAAAGNDQTLFVEQPIVFDDDRRVGPRIFEETVGTLQAFMGTGGNNTPMVAIPIQDGREIEKNQNGLGIAESGAPAYTLDQTGAQAVAYSFDSLASNSMKSCNPNSGVRETDIAKTLDTARPDPSCNQGGIAIVEPIGIQGNVIGRQDHNGPAGKGHTEEGDPMFTLNTTDRHAVIHSFDTQFGSNANVFNDQTPPLKASQASPSVVEPTMSVRRLTPLECERLMGWPDDWTAGQADTHRYKQCGNGVASPVAQWIGEQILNIPQ
jgi:DNA (cytosine-5)-methyltransferase 1